MLDRLKGRSCSEFKTMFEFFSRQISCGAGALLAEKNKQLLTTKLVLIIVSLECTIFVSSSDPGLDKIKVNLCVSVVYFQLISK